MGIEDSLPPLYFSSTPCLRKQILFVVFHFAARDSFYLGPGCKNNPPSPACQCWSKPPSVEWLRNIFNQFVCYDDNQMPNTHSYIE